MKAVSLFSGIGGIDIGLAAAGFDIVAQVEIDGYCQQVLRKHSRQWWPNAVIHDDAREFGADSIGRSSIDILAGGFPCQPFSTAGVQLGRKDPRNMWPETRRIIGEIQPRAVLLENVAGLITRTGDTPGYVGTVLADLSEMGYVGAWGVISAADAGASHRRERIWIVGYTTERRSPESPTSARGKRARIRRKGQPGSADMAHDQGVRLEKPDGARVTTYSAQDRNGMATGSSRRGRMGNSASQRRTRYGASRQQVTGTRRWPRRYARPDYGQAKRLLDGSPYGIPSWLDSPEFPAPQGIYQHEWEPQRTVNQPQQYRRQRIQALGNAVIPQIVYYIAKEIAATLIT